MELEAVDKGVVRLSVPTRFLRNWIQSHYSEHVLADGRRRSRDHAAGTERSLGDASARWQPKPRPPEPSLTRECRDHGRRQRAAHQRAVYDGARGAWRLAARSAPDLRKLHRRPLEHAGPCRGQAGRDQPARRALDVQSALHPCRGRASAKPICCRRLPGPATAPRPQDALSDRRALHVRLRLGAAKPRPRWPSRKRYAPSTCW